MRQGQHPGAEHGISSRCGVEGCDRILGRSVPFDCDYRSPLRVLR